MDLAYFISGRIATISPISENIFPSQTYSPNQIYFLTAKGEIS